jgi:hypothetical protein
VEIEIAGQWVRVERIMPGSASHEMTVVLPRVEIRKTVTFEPERRETQEVVINSVTVVSSPVRPEARNSG